MSEIVNSVLTKYSVSNEWSVPNAWSVYSNSVSSEKSVANSCNKETQCIMHNHNSDFSLRLLL